MVPYLARKIFPFLCVLCLSIPLPLSAAEPVNADGAFLGVVPDEVPESLLVHLGIEGGVLVQDVLEGSPAAKAGLRRHDVITAADGKALKTAEDLRAAVAAKKPGEQMPLAGRRGGENLITIVTLSDRKESPRDPASEDQRPEKRPGFLGIQFAAVPEALAAHLGLEKGSGVLVTEVFKESAAAKAGLAKNDVLVAAGGTAITCREGGESPLDVIVPDRRFSLRRDLGAYSRDVLAEPFQAAAQVSNLPEVLRRYHEGDPVEIEFIQKGKRQKAEVTLGATPREFEGDDLRGPRRSLRFYPPRSHLRGKLLWRDDDGKEREVEIPGFDFDRDFLPEHLHRRLEEYFHGEKLPERIREKVQSLLGRGLRLEIEEDVEVDEDSDVRSSSSNVSVVREVDDDFEVTLRDENGRRTVSARDRKQDKVLADELPFEKLDTLPNAVQERVKRMAEGLPKAKVRREVRIEPLRRLDPNPEPERTKVREDGTIRLWSLEPRV
jgi:hypothetical protein